MGCEEDGRSLSTSAPSSVGTSADTQAEADQADENEKVLAGLLSDHTLLLLDWDDTFFPSTWALEQGLRASRNAELTPELKHALKLCASSVERTLQTAVQSGTVVIVTNAEQGWVQHSAMVFMPQVAKLLCAYQVRIVSARTQYEAKVGPSANPLAWKEHAFQAEISVFAHERGLLNAISIGDSVCEREALLSKASACRHARIKSIKLPDRPTVTDLVATQELLAASLRVFCEHDGHLDLCLVQPERVA